MVPSKPSLLTFKQGPSTGWLFGPPNKTPTTPSPSATAGGTVTNTISTGIRDNDNNLGPRWEQITWTAPTTGQVTFNFTWTGTGKLRYVITEQNTNLWIAESPYNSSSPQTQTATVIAGHTYNIPVWATAGNGNHTLSATYPQPADVTKTISTGIRDNNNNLGPRWEQTTWTAPTTGQATFNFTWTGTGKLRYVITEQNTNLWIAESPYNSSSPQTQSANVTAGHTYNIPVWATTGNGNHTLTVTYPGGGNGGSSPSRVVHTGNNNVNGNTTTSLPLHVPANGRVYISLNYEPNVAELHLYLKRSNGSTVASTPTVWVAKGIEEVLDPGDYTIQVVAASGGTDWHMEVYYEPTAAKPSAPVGAPNIIVINTDDQRADSLRHLPKISNWFVDQGLKFDNGYVTTPSCCPSRAALFTGQLNHNNGVVGQRVPELNQNETLQRELTDAGYFTSFSGKFVHFWPQQLTAPHWDNWTYFKGGYYNTWINSDGANALQAQNTTIHTFDKGMEFIDGFKAQDDSRPWFLHLTPVVPHKPATPEPQYANAFVLPRLQTPNIDEADRSDKPQYMQFRNRTAADMEDLRLRMVRSLYTLDDQVDRLMWHLQATGELDNTLIILTSDNGYMWGEHLLDEKFTPYDVSIRVPFLVYWQGHVTPGSTDDRWVANIDIAPTVLAAAGIPIPTQTDGVDIFSGYDRSYVYTEYFRDPVNNSDIPGWKSIRNDSFIYTQYYASDETTVIFQEYYNLSNDPYQLVNLLADGNPNNNPAAGWAASHTGDLRQLRWLNLPSITALTQ